MRYICTSDSHFTHIRPVHRIDAYVEVSLAKMLWVVLLCNKYKAALIIAGDIFDGIKVPYYLVNRLSDILKKCKMGVFTIAGQHDMEYKSLDLEPSPYSTLQRTGAITNLGENKYLQGISWGEKVVPKNKPILVVHYTITEKEPPFFLKDAISADEAFEKYKGYKYIISGDYHHSYVKRKNGRVLINCGPILRSSKDQYDFRPKVYLIDTEKNGLKAIYVPIVSPEYVFNIPKEIETDNAFSDKMKEFIIKLNESKKRPNYETVVKMILKETNASENVQSIAEHYINEVRQMGK